MNPPPTTPRSVAVVGAGMAGLRTVAELRAAGYAGELTVLGAEPVPPYDRPPLSKELFSRPEPLWLEQDLGHDLRALADDVRLGTAARALEVDGVARLSLSDGSTLEADAVVVACGSRALRPRGWDRARVLHSLDDAAGLREALVPGSRFVVVGAGWIGAEVAGVAARAGCEVTVLEAGPAPLARQLGADLGARTVGWYAEAGVGLHVGAAVAAVDEHGVRTADGRLFAADVVLCAIGARPATDWLDGVVPRLPSGHLPVDAGGATAVHGVWAVGDVAARRHPVFGEVPGGHWSAALTDPAPLARALTGQGADGVAEPAPYVYSTQLGHHLAVFGALTDDLVTRGDPDGGPWTTLAFSGAELVGAVVADAPREVSAVRRLLGRGGLPRLDRTAAADPTVRLAAALAG